MVKLGLYKLLSYWKNNYFPSSSWWVLCFALCWRSSLPEILTYRETHGHVKLHRCVGFKHLWKAATRSSGSSVKVIVYGGRTGKSGERVLFKRQTIHCTQKSRGFFHLNEPHKNKTPGGPHMCSSPKAAPWGPQLLASASASARWGHVGGSMSQALCESQEGLREGFAHRSSLRSPGRPEGFGIGWMVGREENGELGGLGSLIMMSYLLLFFWIHTMGCIWALRWHRFVVFSNFEAIF